MLTTEDADEKATQIDNVVKMVMEKDGADGSKADKKISQEELKQALADTGILTACMGQVHGHVHMHSMRRCIHT